MMNAGKLRVIYAGVAVALVLSLVACEPTTQTKIEASDKEDVTKNLETTTKAQDLKEENSDVSPTESATEKNVKLPKYLPTDFPLPDDVEITTSNSEQNEGKKSVLLIIRTKKDMETITSMYTTYHEGRKLEDASQTIDSKNIVIQGKSPTHSENWSLIGGNLASMDGVTELVITWEEL